MSNALTKQQYNEKIINLNKTCPTGLWIVRLNTKNGKESNFFSNGTLKEKPISQIFEQKPQL